MLAKMFACRIPANQIVVMESSIYDATEQSIVPSWRNVGMASWPCWTENARGFCGHPSFFILWGNEETYALTRRAEAALGQRGSRMVL